MLNTRLGRHFETQLVRPGKFTLVFADLPGRGSGHSSYRTFSIRVANLSRLDSVSIQFHKAFTNRAITDGSFEALAQGYPGAQATTLSDVNATFPAGNGFLTPANPTNIVTVVRGGVREFTVTLPPGYNTLAIRGSDSTKAALVNFTVDVEDDTELVFVSPQTDRRGEETYFNGQNTYGVTQVSASTPVVMTSTAATYDFTTQEGTNYAFSIAGTWGGATAAFYYWDGNQWVPYKDATNTNVITATADFGDTFITPLTKFRVVLTGASGTTSLTTVLKPLAN